MDPSLLRQREAFKSRALSLPVIEKKSIKTSSSVSAKKPPKTSQASTLKPSSSSSKLFSHPNLNKHKFALLAQIVNHMKNSYQNGNTHALTLDEILEECHLDETISTVHRNWLQNEALLNNPKIEVVNEGPIAEVKFAFKPKYFLKDRKALLKKLDRHDQRGLGGIMWDDIEEGLPKAKKAVKVLGDKILFVSRPDKKQIVFYNDRSCEIVIDEEFQKLWRSVTVDSVDDNKIEEYLNTHGITSMQDKAVAKPVVLKRKKGNRKRKFKSHNDHLGGVLQDYSAAKK
uniref:Transcription initiation factor IIE subunit beta n=1 Tax=Phallusia mammillata TaxID=59560 RepID=A0A6F9DER9_9ASCI|nr:general transcription factor IIE subunit 2-like [Phallusia mammillata]